MISSIDHIVIVVNNLERAVSDYSALGFTITPGGEHTMSPTHNALVTLADGSYLELIAFKGPAPADHPFFREHGSEGIVTFALLPTDTPANVAAARKRGLEVEGPFPGGRVRPDGQKVEWLLAMAGSKDLPFLCGDVTPRELRVPGGPAARHPNGITGIATVTVLVRDIQKSAQRYCALLGREWENTDEPQNPQQQDGRRISFRLGTSRVELLEPSGGPMLDYLQQRGEGPYSLALTAAGGASEGALDETLTHGAHIWVVEDDSQRSNAPQDTLSGTNHGE